jgi:AraC-like DNA-binding protein
MALAQVHSMPATVPEAAPATVPPAPCATVSRPAHPALRHAILGYGGFRSGSGTRLAHRLLPLACTTLILDFDDPDGLVTGARGAGTDRGPTTWGHGVSVALTPAGAAGLLGTPMPEMIGATVPLTTVAGHRAAELIERLAGTSGWAERFALLDALLPAWAAGSRKGSGGRTGSGGGGGSGGVPPLVQAAWWRLQGGDRPGVEAVAAEAGVSRRWLERAFARHIGLGPAAVARIARFQRTVGAFGRGVPLAEAAAVCGYADQPHLSRETRALAGLTPAELCRAANLQDPLSDVA